MNPENVRSLSIMLSPITFWLLFGGVMAIGIGIGRLSTYLYRRPRERRK
jgi:hypothetical protein